MKLHELKKYSRGQEVPAAGRSWRQFRLGAVLAAEVKKVRNPVPALPAVLTLRVAKFRFSGGCRNAVSRAGIVLITL